ncbi:hypothetical protein L798_14048 [Zootermopsis nevadensis]|uniref:Uncharacterized protein n=1 Tax=Zootermopsis nevadensis TaxID=136037 RepID=A0A067R316_ZOONE|nr:hypothetical protein L798_14048 [Zootermopsis nevadensis]
MIIPDTDYNLIQKASRSLCNSLLIRLGANWIPVITDVRSNPSFRLKPKSVTKYLKDVYINANKPVLNSEYNQDNNSVVHHHNIRGLSNKTDQLSVSINNKHTP